MSNVFEYCSVHTEKLQKMMLTFWKKKLLSLDRGFLGLRKLSNLNVHTKQGSPIAELGI